MGRRLICTQKTASVISKLGIIRQFLAQTSKYPMKIAQYLDTHMYNI